MKQRQTWLDYVSLRNSEAATTASRAWVTSQAWVNAEAYIEALSSTWTVTCFSLLAIGVAGFVYTMDLEILGIIIAISMAACAFLSFSMFCIFQWAFGPWELILMTVFLTYYVEPALRVGRDFVLPSSRIGLAAVPAIQGDSNAAGIADGETDRMGEGHQAGAEIPGTQGEKSSEKSSESHKIGDSMGSPTPCPGMGAHGEGSEKDEGRNEDEEPSEYSSAEDQADDSPAAALHRSVQQQSGAILAGAAKIFLCGIFLLPCHFRLFTRLGAVGVVVSFIMPACTLLLLPACILFSGRTRREPDIKPISRCLYDKCSWLWT